MTRFLPRSALLLFAALSVFPAATCARAADARYQRQPAFDASPAPVRIPDELAALDNTPADNPASPAGIRLGRVLFYDRELSANGLVSCSSCHAQGSGFDDPTRFSIGFTGRITRRSAMALANARFNPRGHYFRDERAPSLEAQVLMPFTDGVEMGLKSGELPARIASRPWYGPLFEAAFGDPEITEARAAKALAQFARSIVALHSRYDTARAGKADLLADFPEFSDAENRGKFLFMAPRERGGAGCAACHQSDAFVTTEPHDNGLPVLKDRPDDGNGEITGLESDKGRFRAASLKNIAMSGPYMHDGRFETLEQVIDHYSIGIVGRPNLAPELTDADGRPIHFDFSQEDKDALIAFLNTLTDERMLDDPRFGDPFRGASN